jgi:hypothetical protein
MRFSETADLLATEAGRLPKIVEIVAREDAAKAEIVVDLSEHGVDAKATIRGMDSADHPAPFHFNPRGIGVAGGKFGQVESGESIHVTFDQDVMIESAGIVAGNGACGGYYQAGDRSPLAIYCVDADIDAKDQSGLLSDIGVLKAGEALRFDSTPHYGVETPGQWRLESLTVRALK